MSQPNKKPSTFHGILGLTVLILIIWGIVTLFKQNIIEVTAIIALVSLVISHNYTRKREIDSRLFDKKAEVYGSFIKLYTDILKGVKKDSNLDEEELLERAFGIKEGLLIWASNEVLKSYQQLEQASSKEDNVRNTMLELDSIILKIRKDLGYSSSGIEAGELVRLFLNEDIPPA